MHTIKTITISNPEEGIQQISDLLTQHITHETVLWLSGGSTPQKLYALLATQGTIEPGACAIVDERYGEKYHEHANERMIKEAGLLDYLNSKHIPWHPILQEEKMSIRETAALYDQTVTELFQKYPKHVLIMGLGGDGHTAGIMTDMPKTDAYVCGYTTAEHEQKERITITPTALNTLADNKATFIILAWGKEKRHAVEQVLLGDVGVAGGQYVSLTNQGASVYVVKA